jgi:hypothetical protein
VAHYSFKSFDKKKLKKIGLQSNAQQLLIICGTMVWHSPVLKVLIHLFELTSCMVQHSMVSKIINKNVFMVKLSNIS